MLVVTFTQSLAPSETARAKAIAMTIPHFQLATYRTYDGHKSRLIVVRTASDEIWAFSVPLRLGKVGMPDLHLQDFPLRDRLISRVGDHPKEVTGGAVGDDS